MQLTKLLLAINLLLSTVSTGQDLKGTWTGELFQKFDKKYYFEMRIDKVSSNGKLSGTTYISSYGGDQSLGEEGDFATIKFKGKISNNNLKFKESRILRQDKSSNSFYWCIKKGSLKLEVNENEYTLSGKWKGRMLCFPGTLTVKKERIQTPQLEHRNVDTKHYISVNSDSLALEIWDNNKEDGDIVSLNLNGEWILKNLEVTKTKKKINIRLPKKENVLILYAENLGEIPPNTAAISLFDGKETQQVIVHSDESISEGIKIIYQ